MWYIWQLKGSGLIRGGWGKFMSNYTDLINFNFQLTKHLHLNMQSFHLLCHCQDCMDQDFSNSLAPEHCRIIPDLHRRFAKESYPIRYCETHIWRVWSSPTCKRSLALVVHCTYRYKLMLFDMRTLSDRYIVARRMCCWLVEWSPMMNYSFGILSRELHTVNCCYVIKCQHFKLTFTYFTNNTNCENRENERYQFESLHSAQKLSTNWQCFDKLIVYLYFPVADELLNNVVVFTSTSND